MIDDFRPAPRRAKSLQANTNTLKAETLFMTPGQVAADDTAAPTRVAVPPRVSQMPATPQERAPLGRTAISSSVAPPTVPDFKAFEAPEVPKSYWSRLKLSWPPSRRQVLVIAGIVILLGSGIGAAMSLQKPAPVASKPVVKVKKQAPKPVVLTTVASSLSGLQVDPSINTKPVVGVMIENSTNARPQSGLSQANVVFEAIAEGGITRFLALFQDTNPADIGPIRSVRPYYLQWAMGFNAAVAHVGGSPEALQNIKDWGTRDLDQFFNAGAYRRTANREAPHNVHSAVDTLTQLSQSKGFAGSTFTPWARKVEAASKAPNVRTIDMALSGPLYNVHYDYDATTNSYKRSMAGAPHVDADGGVQISPKVVVGLVMPYVIQPDGKHLDYGVIGSGQAYIFQDGTLTIGNWNKADRNTMLTFTDANGQALPLNPGQTWLTAVTDSGKITAAP